MRLTKKKAIEITKELWDWLAETGKNKPDWAGWKKYGEMECFCPFCKYDSQQAKVDEKLCTHCPYFEVFGSCLRVGTPFVKWRNARAGKDSKKYAKFFREQLEQL